MKILNDIRTRVSVVAQQMTEVVSLLMQSGVLEFLRERSSAVVMHGEHSIEKAALAAARSAGYAECLQDILYFKEKYLSDTGPSSAKLEMSFGAKDRVLTRGDLTKDDLHGIESEQSDTAAAKKFITKHEQLSAEIRANYADYERQRNEWLARQPNTK